MHKSNVAILSQGERKVLVKLLVASVSFPSKL